ncbi:hypothetical protein AB4Z18_14825 [Leifsonia sp. 2TAF2]|uniref:hypothetical protein n=1 Tax=Leifsonia sp. 2TAF2 TaxID=3233009 RepID=UPI003F964947
MTEGALAAIDERDTETRDSAFGRIELSTVPLPDGVQLSSATYLPSGDVFVLFRRPGDHDDWFRVGIVHDDGTEFREIFSGAIPQSPTANGIRHMPFSDGRRVLLGDYVLEATPDLGTATTVELLRVEYPWELTSDPLTSHHWSEIIVSPDDRHIAWTVLRTDMSAVVALGRLERGAGRYTIEEPAIISSSEAVVPDPARDGWFRMRPMLGGEVKQFVRGGAAISSVGDGGGALTDSIIQSLTSEHIEPITRTPGYDETTILSPDERLGIVMTGRASRETDLAFLGLVSRPHAQLVTMDLAWVLYVYAVDGVRRFRPGNIGPVLIDIQRSMTEPGYLGVPLNSGDASWVYVSPMSWHPDGTRTMWMEQRRGSGEGGDPELRIRVARLSEHAPAAAVPVVATPGLPPYAVAGEDARERLRHRIEVVPSGRIAGAHSGHLEFERSSDGHGTWSAFSRYVDFSDDGRAVYNGYERSSGSMASGAVYEADLVAEGEVSGEMRLRATWSGVQQGARLLFGTAEDGRPQSFGSARFGDAVARVEDLVE